MSTTSAPVPTSMDRDEQLAPLASMLKLLADPTRLRIFDLLMQGVQCNCELSSALEMRPNLISHHLRALRTAGLVDVEQDQSDARWLYYLVNQSVLGEFRTLLDAFLNPSRIEARQPSCGPARA